MKSPNKLSMGSWLGSRLEEFDHHPSIDVSLFPVPQLVKMNNIFDQYLQSDCFESIQRWPIINVVALIYGYSYLI